MFDAAVAPKPRMSTVVPRAVDAAEQCSRSGCRPAREHILQASRSATRSISSRRDDGRRCAGDAAAEPARRSPTLIVGSRHPASVLRQRRHRKRVRTRRRHPARRRSRRIRRRLRSSYARSFARRPLFTDRLVCTTSDAKDATRTAYNATHTRAARLRREARRHVSKSWEMMSRTAFASVRCHRCESRSVWTSPSTGWVTVLAGLLARGSLPCVRPSRFPSGHGWTQSSPLTVAGAATDWANSLENAVPCSLLLPRLLGEPARENTCPRLWTSQAAHRPSDWQRTMLWPNCRCQNAERPALRPASLADANALRRGEPRCLRSGPSSSSAHAGYARHARDGACGRGILMTFTCFARA